MPDRRPTAISGADDTAARERALDATRSFLVQAPAGSGKTELLIQRFLALLAQVDRPERIVAMTFTRKAAGEMRERIVGALRDAIAETAADSPHAMRTRDLARVALDADRRHGWQLVTHPARLAVFTIDAFAAGLARQAPLATGMGATPRYAEHAAPLYAAAAAAALAAAPADDAAWLRLLAHLDNDASRAIMLVAGMLAKRDQWIGEVRPADRTRFRAAIEATLDAEITGELAAVAALFPAPVVAALARHERYAAANLALRPGSEQWAAELAACAPAGGIPPATVPARERWQALANWLLVASDARFRLQVNINVGFPPKGKGDGANERDHENEAMRAFLVELAAIDGLADALDAVRPLPPLRCDDAAWSLVDALLDILPRAAAELTLGFRAAGAIDFTQGTLAALEALGDAESPSDLLLKLDLRILHLLVDEFQDTSYTQLELIRRLTAGWQPDDGRTLFAVGDPMQSIYRFRGAEVRLFVDAQASGCIGDLPVENIVLRRNFRSQEGLVQWANGVFPGVLGPRSDPWRGIVGFVSAVPVRDALPGAAVTVDVLPDPEAEARTIVGHLQAALAAGAQSIAVLVRARAHLAVVLPALRGAGIAFAAVEFDPLAERQAMRDLTALTHALVQPADRLAWLAVLRAPWCGLALPDLVAVAAAADARDDRSVAGLVRVTESISGLSQDGRARLARNAPALAAALDARGRAGVAARVRGTWLALGGSATLEDPIDLAAAERFFAVVAAHEVAGDIPDWPALVDALGKLYAEPDHSGSARVQIMTLHRAKGLEFDTVVLAGLARVPNRGGGEVLRWRRRPKGLLLAPMKARGADADLVYAYLTRLADGEEDAELGRLLYVGCTRAKCRLHLTGVLPSDAAKSGTPVWQMPPAGSALAKFRSVLADVPAPPVSVSGTNATVSPVRRLTRLPLVWVPPVPVASVPVAVSPSPRRERLPFDWAHEAARHVGTVAHRLFAQIAREGLSAWDASRMAALAPRVRVELEAEGVDAALLAGAIVAVATAVERLLGDDRGRWLLDAGHAEATSEWMLAGWDGDAVAHVAIDRTFVAGDVRWIVDFKTSVHEGADIDGFLDREMERYRGQLERYARFVRALDSRPIRLGLYYPMHGGWREWPYAG